MASKKTSSGTKNSRSVAAAAATSQQQAKSKTPASGENSTPSSAAPKTSQNEPKKLGAWASVIKNNASGRQNSNSSVTTTPQTTNSNKNNKNSASETRREDRIDRKLEYTPVGKFNNGQISQFLRSRFDNLNKKNYYKPFNSNNWNLNSSKKNVNGHKDGVDILYELNRN